MAKRVIISDESVNCYGTWVRTEGVDISQYERNPVLLWMHWRGVIIGCVKDIRKENGKITGEPWFDEVREESKQAKRQWEKGTLRMVSANLEVIETNDDPALVKPGQYRAVAWRSKLVEVSMVDIGGNDNALPLVFTYKDKELKLAAGENSEGLPLLTYNNNNQKEEKMDYKVIALKLGLPETATRNLSANTNALPKAAAWKKFFLRRTAMSACIKTEKSKWLSRFRRKLWESTAGAVYRLARN